MFELEETHVFDKKLFTVGSIVTYCVMELEDKYPPVDREYIEGEHTNGLVNSYKPDEISLILSNGRFREIKIAQVFPGPTYKKGNLPIKIISVAKSLQPLTEEEK